MRWKICTPGCSGRNDSILYCPHTALLWNVDLMSVSLSLSFSLTASFSSRSKPEGLCLVPAAAYSRWSSWADRAVVTCRSCTSSWNMRTVVLGLTWLCLCLSLDALALSGRKADAGDGEGAQAAIRGERPLRRVRRGWMWNQFFLQEEYTGSDYQYIGKVRAAPVFVVTHECWHGPVCCYMKFPWFVGKRSISYGCSVSINCWISSFVFLFKVILHILLMTCKHDECAWWSGQECYKLVHTCATWNGFHVKNYIQK